MSKINIENAKENAEVEVPGAGQFGVREEQVVAAVERLHDKYEHLVDDSFLDVFCAGLFFTCAPEYADVFGDSVEEYFANALRNINRSKSAGKVSGVSVAISPADVSSMSRW